MSHVQLRGYITVFTGAGLINPAQGGSLFNYYPLDHKKYRLLAAYLGPYGSVHWRDLYVCWFNRLEGWFIFMPYSG